MTDDEKQLLNASAMEVFGTMYFTPIELMEETPVPEDEDGEAFIRASISYSGPREADIVFYFPRRLGETIAEGFLGLDPEALEEEQVVDTMREAANMIVGNFLGKIDPDGACALSIPEAAPVAGLRENIRAMLFTDVALMRGHYPAWLLIVIVAVVLTLMSTRGAVMRILSGMFAGR